MGAIGSLARRAAALREAWTARRRAPAGARAARGRGGRRSTATPAVVGAASALLLAVAVFLPWYSLNLGAPFETGSASGWRWTGVAQVAFALALLGLGAGTALALDASDVIRLEPEPVRALEWLLPVASAIAAALIAYRVLVPPEPSDLLSRAFGLYVALVAALGALGAGAARLTTRA